MVRIWFRIGLAATNCFKAFLPWNFGFTEPKDFCRSPRRRDDPNLTGVGRRGFDAVCKAHENRRPQFRSTQPGPPVNVPSVSWDRSCSQAKKTQERQRCCVTWSRMTPRSTVYQTSSLPMTDRSVASPSFPTILIDTRRCSPALVRAPASTSPWGLHRRARSEPELADLQFLGRESRRPSSRCG